MITFDDWEWGSANHPTKPKKQPWKQPQQEPKVEKDTRVSLSLLLAPALQFYTMREINQYTQEPSASGKAFEITKAFEEPKPIEAQGMVFRVERELQHFVEFALDSFTGYAGIYKPKNVAVSEMMLGTYGKSIRVAWSALGIDSEDFKTQQGLMKNFKRTIPVTLSKLILGKKVELDKLEAIKGTPTERCVQYNEENPDTPVTLTAVLSALGKVEKNLERKVKKELERKRIAGEFIPKDSSHLNPVVREMLHFFDVATRKVFYEPLDPAIGKAILKPRKCPSPPAILIWQVLGSPSRNSFEEKYGEYMVTQAQGGLASIQDDLHALDHNQEVDTSLLARLSRKTTLSRCVEYNRLVKGNEVNAINFDTEDKKHIPGIFQNDIFTPEGLADALAKVFYLLIDNTLKPRSRIENLMYHLVLKKEGDFYVFDESIPECLGVQEEFLEAKEEYRRFDREAEPHIKELLQGSQKQEFTLDLTGLSIKESFLHVLRNFTEDAPSPKQVYDNQKST